MPCFFEVSPESSPGPLPGRPLGLARPFGNGQEGKSNFILARDFLRVVGAGSSSLARDAALLQEASSIP